MSFRKPPILIILFCFFLLLILAIVYSIANLNNDNKNYYIPFAIYFVGIISTFFIH